MSKSLLLKLVSITSIAGCVYFLGVSTLWLYLYRLGRLDLFHSVIEKEKSLDIITFFLLISLLIISLALFMPSIFTVLFLNEKSNKENIPDKNPYSKKAILITSLVTIITIDAISYLLPYSIAVSLILSTFLLSIILNIVAFYFFEGRKYNTLSYYVDTSIPKKITFLIAPPLIISSIAILPLTFLIGLYPLLQIENEPKSLSLISIITMSLLVIFLSLIPADLFLGKKEKKSLFIRSYHAVSSSLMIIIILSSVINPIPVIIIDTSLRFSGVTDFRVHDYTINGKVYTEEIFDYPEWEKKSLKSENKFTIAGVTIFSYKDISLICPSNIIEIYKESRKFSMFNSKIDDENLKKLREKTQECFIFDKKEIMQWNPPHK
ncbi:hypothetical protein [Pantoea ananatis]|uniref:hypothetical protein n=1 Tax=Pantoea ananas TaxID=553 RepID=UPI0021F76C41|nr:hypothetical protein [Pantoea ananatis]